MSLSLQGTRLGLSIGSYIIHQTNSIISKIINLDEEYIYTNRGRITFGMYESEFTKINRPTLDVSMLTESQKDLLQIEIDKFTLLNQSQGNYRYSVLINEIQVFHCNELLECSKYISKKSKEFSIGGPEFIYFNLTEAITIVDVKTGKQIKMYEIIKQLITLYNSKIDVYEYQRKLISTNKEFESRTHFHFTSIISEMLKECNQLIEDLRYLND